MMVRTGSKHGAVHQYVCLNDPTIPSGEGIAKVGVVQCHVASNSIQSEGSPAGTLWRPWDQPNSPTPPRSPT
jgi:hypothetical protein